MTSTLCSDPIDALLPHRRRYRAALQNPAGDPLCWLVADSPVAFDADEVLAKIAENRLTVARCLATLRAAAALPDDATNPVFEQLEQIIAACQNASLSYLNEQLLRVELPVMLLHKFEGDRRYQRLGDDATDLLSQRVGAVLDQDGWPGAEAAEDFGPLAASWTRCVALLESVGWSIEENADKTLRWLPRQIMRLKRPDQTLMLSNSKAPVPEDMLALMIDFFEDADDAIIFQRTLKRPASPKPNLVMLDRSCNTISAWGGSLLFHDRWERKACRIAAQFDNNGCQLEIGKSKALIRGNVFPELIVNGNPLAVVGDPDLLVEYIDRHVAFAEIEWQFENDVVVQRQIILSMEDNFAWIGDAVVVPDHGDQQDHSKRKGGNVHSINYPESAAANLAASEIEYCCRWDLAEGISTIAESETNETYLYDGKKIRGLVIPPSLNEWKSGSKENHIVPGAGDFKISARCLGRRLYVPVFLDLSPKRSLKPRTWRQLTVAESLKIVGPNVAVAYRVQVGKQQYVFYRSMDEPQNRTFFGENVNTEMFLGRLEKNGTMTELVQIE